jgi:release factor glutamine methyltransferase
LTIRELLVRLADELGSRHEATVILEEASGCRLSALAASFMSPAPPALIAAAEELSRERRSGRPLQHVVGHWSFRHLELLQDERALIVRPETEQVVGVALDELARRSGRLVLDLGTGSGAIALGIANEAPGAVVVALDRSAEALALATANRARRDADECERVHLLVSNWYSALSSVARFDLIVANPPYVSEAEWMTLDPVVRDHDPKAALVAGPSGLEAIDAILAGAPEHLVRGGVLVCEIGATQKEPTLSAALGAGARAARVEVDLAGRDRILVAQF